MGGWGRFGGGRLPFRVRRWPALRVLTFSLYSMTNYLPSQRSGAPKSILSSLALTCSLYALLSSLDKGF